MDGFSPEWSSASLQALSLWLALLFGGVRGASKGVHPAEARPGVEKGGHADSTGSCVTRTRTWRSACPPACGITPSASAATSTSAPTTDWTDHLHHPPGPRELPLLRLRLATGALARPGRAPLGPCPSAAVRPSWPCPSRGSNVSPAGSCARSRSPSPTRGAATPPASSDYALELGRHKRDVAIHGRWLGNLGSPFLPLLTSCAPISSPCRKCRARPSRIA